VGVLVPRLSDIVLATIYEGIEEAAAEHGLSTFVTNTHDNPADQRARTEMVLARRVDGLIFGDAHFDARFVDEIAGRGVPFELPIPLTTVRWPMHEMGARSVELLVRLLAGETVESERLRPELVVRASSDPNRLPHIISPPTAESAGTARRFHSR
jgi:DNA-binding LacI/PurR family transcriptional regulator